MNKFLLLLALLFPFNAVAATFTDPYDTEDYIDELLGSEIASGELRNKDLDEGTVLNFNAASSEYGTATGYKGVTGTAANTAMGWFKTTSTAVGLGIIYWGEGSTAARRLIALENGVLWDRMVGNTINGGSNLNDGQWHHWAISKPSGGTVSGFKIYIDGISVTVNTSGSATIDIIGTNDLNIGSQQGSNTFFDGDLDDIRLYSRELTADEIFALVHGGVEPSTTGLEGHWKLNDGSGTSATDSSGNGRTITLGNTPTWTTTHPSFYNTRSRTTSTDIISTATSVDSFAYTPLKKPASIGRYQFSEDGTTWKNSNGDTVSGYGAYNFDGVNDLITVSDHNDFSFGNGSTDSAFSLSAWIFMRDATLFKIMMKDDNSTQREWRFHVDASDNLYLLLVDQSAGANIGRYVPMGNYEKEWIHVAATYDGSSTTGGITLYINGIEVTSTATSFGSYVAMENLTDDVEIGAWTGASQYADGFISDPRIYAEELTSTKIYDLYAKSIEPDATNLKGWWKFNGNANDSSGNGHNGTVSGAVNTTSWYYIPALGDGEPEDTNTRYFDGSNDQVSISDNDAFTFGNGSTDSAFSLSAWMYADDISSFSVISKNVTSNQEWGMKFSPTNYFLFSIFDNSASARLEISSLIPLTHLQGKWIHVAATYDGSGTNAGMKIYINGSQLATSNNNSGTYTAMENKTGTVYIGHDPVYVGGIYANGRIANVSIWSDVRTQAEIITEVQNGYVDLADVNLIASWPLNDTGSTADNAEATATYDGTISGATRIDDITRPAPAQPTARTIDLSALGFNSLYYRTEVDNVMSFHGTYALGAALVNYTSGSPSEWIKKGGFAPESHWIKEKLIPITRWMK